MKLVIVESPNKLSSIKKYLNDDTYEVLASYGHIRDLPFKNLGIDIKNNFSPKYVLLPDKIQVLQNILNLAEQSEKIYLATDPDREGAGIAFSLYHYLKPLNKPIKRIIFKKITKEGILEGLENEKPLEEESNLVEAFHCRRLLDRLVGYMVSPFLMKYFGPNLSAGRVQSVACRLIVEREKEIENFKPQEYFNILGQFSTKNQEIIAAKLEKKITKQEQVDLITKEINSEKEYIISEVKAVQKAEKPTPPLITITLQQYMAKRYGMTPDKTMNIAQRLFEQGHISYIRTDDTRISEEAIIEAREFLNERYPLPKKGIQYSSDKSQAEAHECLRPLNVSLLPSNLFAGKEDKLVYQAIWEHFLASQLTPAIWNTLQLKIVGVNNPNLIFKISGKALEDPGYLAIFGPIEKGKIEIPFVKKGDKLQMNIKSLKIEKKKTQPTPRFNDTTILKTLEQKGIGRPATYSSILKTILNRKYVEKDGISYIPTNKGRETTSILEKFFGYGFMDFNFTAIYENKLDLIAQGKLTSLEVLNEFYKEFKTQLEQAYEDQQDGIKTK